MQQNKKTCLLDLDKANTDHLTIMYSVRTHPDVDHYLRGSPPACFDDHVNYLRNVGTHKKFYIIEVDSVLSGYCQLAIADNQVEIGMALHPDYCNKGIGSIALSLLLERLQDTENTKGKSIILFVKKDNPRAIALYCKYGFQLKGNENEHEEYLMQKNH